MDAMALLCNLHADGPATLRALRASGCASLEDLIELSSERVAELLGLTPAAARRFLREGQTLSERLGSGLLEREEELGAPASQPRTGASPERLPGRDRQILADVIRRWNEEERGTSAARSSRNGAASDARDAGPDRRAEAQDEGEELATELLAPGIIEGLDAEACRRLAAAGIGSVEDLAVALPEAVATASGLGFTRVRRLQFFASRRLERGELVPMPRPLASEPPEEKISLAFPIRPDAVDAVDALRPPTEIESRGGPFA